MKLYLIDSQLYLNNSRIQAACNFSGFIEQGISGKEETDTMVHKIRVLLA